MIVVLLLTSLLFLGIVLALFEGLKRKGKNTSTDIEEEAPDENECCGQHEVCERDSLLSAVSKEIEYYNDEELDVYQYLSPSQYDETITNEFSEVFYTLKEEEVAGWVRSLQLRHIELPQSLKDEVILILSERRLKT